MCQTLILLDETEVTTLAEAIAVFGDMSPFVRPNYTKEVVLNDFECCLCPFDLPAAMARAGMTFTSPDGYYTYQQT